MKKPMLSSLNIDDVLRAALREDMNGEDISTQAILDRNLRPQPCTCISRCLRSATSSGGPPTSRGPSRSFPRTRKAKDPSPKPIHQLSTSLMPASYPFRSLAAWQQAPPSSRSKTSRRGSPSQRAWWETAAPSCFVSLLFLKLHCRIFHNNRRPLLH